MDASVREREAEKAVSRMEEAEAVLREYNYDKAKLVPILQAVQARYNWLSKELLSYIACALGLPPQEFTEWQPSMPISPSSRKEKTSSASATAPPVM